MSPIYELPSRFSNVHMGPLQSCSASGPSTDRLGLLVIVFKQMNFTVGLGLGRGIQMQPRWIPSLVIVVNVRRCQRQCRVISPGCGYTCKGGREGVTKG